MEDRATWDGASQSGAAQKSPLQVDFQTLRRNETRLDAVWSAMMRPHFSALFALSLPPTPT